MEDTRKIPLLKKALSKKISIREDAVGGKGPFKYRLRNSDDVQELMTKLCVDVYGRNFGIGNLSLLYEDDSTTNALIPTEKIGNLTKKKLIYRVTQIPVATNQDIPIGTNNQSNENGGLVSISEKTKTEGATALLDNSWGTTNKIVVLVGRTGAGKSLMGNVLLDMYDDVGFKVSHGGDSCTKMVHVRVNVDRNITVNDTKGIFDTDYEFENEYNNAQIETKLFIIKDIMEAIDKVRRSGINAIFLVVRMGRLDGRDSELIDQLANYVFKENVRQKVYLVLTNSKAFQVKDKQKGTNWLLQQVEDNATMRKYFEAAENDHNRVFFVDNQGPSDAFDDEEKESFLRGNRRKAEEIIKVLHQNGDDKVHLQDVYERLCDEYSKLRTSDEIIEHFEENVLPQLQGSKDKKKLGTRHKCILL